MIQGLGGTLCDQYREEKCFISAYDAQTGKLAWKFYTIAKDGEPGGDSWGKLSNLFRAGGDTWITGSYDPDLNLTYWGVAQSKPWMRVSRQSGNGATAYANSTVALDVDTGKLAWYYNHAPGESLDLDEVFERVLVDDGGQKLVFSAGKAGILWKNDRKTGKYLGHKETVFQNIYDSFDPVTGEPHYRNDIVEQQMGQWVQSCPTSEGGHNWHAMSYHPGTNELIIPVTESCQEMNAQKIDLKEGGGSAGGASRRFYDSPGIGRQRGQARGVRCENAEGTVGSSTSTLPFMTAVLSTAGRRGVCRRHGSRIPRDRCENRQGAVGNAARHFGAGFPADVQRRRQAIYRGVDGSRRRQPAHGAHGARAGRALSVLWQRAVRFRIAGQEVKRPTLSDAKSLEDFSDGRGHLAYGAATVPMKNLCDGN